MLKSLLIKNILISTFTNNKRLRFISTLAIYFVIAALLASVTSIYFEHKLSKYKNELLKLELEEFKIQSWLTDSVELGHYLKKGKFNFIIIEGNPNLSIKKKSYFFELLLNCPLVIDLAIKDIENIDNKYLLNKFKVDKIKNENKNINKFLDLKLDQYPEDLLTELEYKKQVDDLLDTIPFKKIKEMLDQSENNLLQINLFFQEYNNIVDKKKDDLKKLIVETTKTSTDAIFYAFFLQLFIFSIVQIFELKELS
jgi:hypothetical protein